MTTPRADPLDMLVDAVLQCHAGLALVVQDAEPVPDVLRCRLREALEPLAARRGDTDVAVSAEVLVAATELIGAASAPGSSGGSAAR